MVMMSSCCYGEEVTYHVDGSIISTVALHKHWKRERWDQRHYTIASKHVHLLLLLSDLDDNGYGDDEGGVYDDGCHFSINAVTSRVLQRNYYNSQA